MNTTVTQDSTKSQDVKDTSKGVKTTSTPTTAVSPAIEVFEGPSGILVVAGVPGTEDKDLSLTITKDVLTLVAERKAKAPFERPFTYKRSFVIPDNVDPEGITAKLEKGELTITLPRRAEAAPRQIPIGKQALSS